MRSRFASARTCCAPEPPFTERQIGMLEHGQRVPRIDTLVKLMAAVEASAADLLDGIAWVPAQHRGGDFTVASRAVPTQRRDG